TIVINNSFYQITPAFYKRSDVEKRNQWVTKFKGFDKDKNKTHVINMFKPQGEKNFYWRTDDNNDDNLYVEFKRESDLISATNRFIYYKHIKAYGISRSSTWPVKNQLPSHVNVKVNCQNFNQTQSQATSSNAILISRFKLNKRVI